MSERAAGILMPISSLPSEYGIGCFSKSAYEFVDWLKKAGQSYWQILPLGPTSYGIPRISHFLHSRGTHISSVWRHWWKKVF